jgi:hypothetical protein
MAINVTYGPISAALGMAQQAGAGQGQVQAQQLQLQKQQRDMELIRMMQQAQAQQDQQDNFAISNALKADDANADLEMKQRAMDAANTQQATENQQRNRQLDISQQGVTANDANAQARMAQSQQYHQQSQENFQTNQDRLNVNSGSDEANRRALDAVRRSASLISAELQKKAKEINSYVIDENKDFATKLDPTPLPGGKHVALGMMPKYQAALQAAQQLQQELDGMNQEVVTRTNSLTGKTAPVVDPSTVNKMVAAPQAAPANSSGGGSPPVVHNMQEYAQVPSGSLYVDSADGQTYRKK